MLNPINTLKNQRVISIDAFRGITFLMMIIVNEIAGVNGVSIWLKHMPADADAMSFPDIVFPAFLFIVGMSIPFGINHRLLKGDSFWFLNRHILLRAFALIVMGFFMVNAEDGFHQPSMPISIHSWALLSYLGFMLIWGVYQFNSLILNRALVGMGIAILITLALLYRGGVDGSQTMLPQWWGILGLIGWAYLLSSWIYQLCRGKQKLLLIAILTCVALYAVIHSINTQLVGQTDFVVKLLLSLDGHAAHCSIVLSGLVCSLIFFEENQANKQSEHLPQRFRNALLFAVSLIVLATILRPQFKISKIYATPSWCLYSAAICIIVFSFLYWIIDLKRSQSWVNLVKPAAINPLVCYLIPFVIEALLKLFNLPSPIHFFEGGTGIMASVIYAFFIISIVAALNKINFKLKF
ncbi:hypothetical protein [Undibacterium sp. Ji22W]|uniref:hypothetical protein n=1 Tax=Undibacterium sp. Ji22W TaxID=3413038 RepID=UPI003BF43346